MTPRPSWIAERNDRGAPAPGFRRRIAEVRHKGCAGKHGPDDLALCADPTPVDNPQGPVAHPVRLYQVFFYDGTDVPRRDSVQVEHTADWYTDGFVVLCHDRK